MVGFWEFGGIFPHHNTKIRKAPFISSSGNEETKYTNADIPGNIVPSTLLVCVRVYLFSASFQKGFKAELNKAILLYLV